MGSGNKSRIRKASDPIWLRTLSEDHPHFKPKYFGDLRARDAAYHQGTVWAWLIGPFIDAWLKLHPDQQQKAGAFLKSFDSHLSEACVGSVSEIFDAQAPYTPVGVSLRHGVLQSCLDLW
jgi:glycogen debranching enzyme